MSQIKSSWANGTQYEKSITDKMTDYEKDVFIYAAQAYSFVITGKGFLTLGQFADEICKVYDQNVPQTAEVCRILRKFSK